MQHLSIAIPHQFDRPEAKKRTERLIAQFRQQYGNTVGRLDERWDGDTMSFTFAAMGESITGRAHVEERAVRLEIDLPWMLSMIAGGIRQVIEREGKLLLEHR